jgi:SAM-dependent methyltransferase
MPDTVSEDSLCETPRYQFNFAWNSPYGHIVKLIEELSISDGLVLDMGCGVGPVAEPLNDLGLDYVGCDTDKDALDALRGRGFSCFEVDLTAHEGLAELVQENLSSEQIRDVKVVLMADVLEHLPAVREVVKSLRRTLTLLGNPLLVISVPNIAHIDIGAKLAFGRFDYTRTGLLDDTHLSFFTESRLSSEFAQVGLKQVAENDFHLNQSDQHFPLHHPAIAPNSPLANLIRHWRGQVDQAVTVNQFIRAYAAIPAPTERPASSEKAPPHPFLSVLMRTQARRPECLREALTCLAAQTTDDFEVKLMVHGHDALVEKVREIVDDFHATFSSRVDVIQVLGGQRARPLNAGLEASVGDYIAFLDDDDLVTGDWVEAFKRGSEDGQGQVVRSVSVNQQVEMLERGGLAPYRLLTNFERGFTPAFDLALHFYRNQTPICSFAVPKTVVDALNLRFDESLPVTEDWEFMLRSTQVAGVHDTMKVTSIYRRWIGGEGSGGMVDEDVWKGVRRAILHRFDQAPLLLPPGSASKLSDVRETANKLPDQRRQHAAEIAHLNAELGRLRSAIERYQNVIAGYENSVSWKVTRPVRILLHYARKILARDSASK